MGPPILPSPGPREPQLQTSSGSSDGLAEQDKALPIGVGSIGAGSTLRTQDQLVALDIPNSTYFGESPIPETEAEKEKECSDEPLVVDNGVTSQRGADAKRISWQPSKHFHATADWWKGLPGRLMENGRMLLSIFKAAPSTWIVPLFFTCLILGLGIWGTVAGAQWTIQHDKEVAYAAATGAVNAFELTMQQAYAPCVTMATFVEQQPYWPSLAKIFPSFAESLYKQVPVGALVEIQFAPQGIITDSYPDDESARGRDLFQESTRRLLALETVRLKTLTLAGPITLFRGGVGLMARTPIFLVNQTVDETYGMPRGTYKCDLCYDQTTGTKFWGFSIAILQWDSLVGPDSQIWALKQQGYLYYLSQPNATVPTEEVVIAQSDPPPPDPQQQDFVYATIKGPPKNPDAVKGTNVNDDWKLYVTPERGWMPAWRDPVIAAVVLGGILIGGLICAVLVNRQRHLMLLDELRTSNKQLADTTENLRDEKVRLDALLVRQYNLISMFEVNNSAGKDKGGQSEEGTAMDRIEALRRQMNSMHKSLDEGEGHIQTLELLGEGTFGKVYKGMWRGTVVAIKTLVLPANMTGQEKREKMAIMEAAISSSLSHPNIVQTYTYAIKPLRDTSTEVPLDNTLLVTSNSDSTENSSKAGASKGTLQGQGPGSAAIHSYEVRLVLEFCDKGNLRDALDQGAFFGSTGLNFRAILDTAADIAKAMLHLHSTNVLHSDLKARNVMLKSAGSEGRGVTAKVADFGLSIKMDHMETHMSNVFQGTMTHMAPEILLEGRVSKAADVYAFGITMWELFTSGHPLEGVPRALIGHQITAQNRRPQFPMATPAKYRELAERCWQPVADLRPTFETILNDLLAMRGELEGETPALDVRVVPPKPHNGGGAPLGTGDAAGTVDAQQRLPRIPVNPSIGISAALAKGNIIVGTLDSSTSVTRALKGNTASRGSVLRLPPQLPPIEEGHQKSSEAASSHDCGPQAVAAQAKAALAAMQAEEGAARVAQQPAEV